MIISPYDLKLEDVPLQKIDIPLTKEGGIELYVKRSDLIHPAISGNKWYKLKYNIIEAGKQGYNKILTFGGAYSNHIYAAASAGKIFGFETIGVIRGEEYPHLNPTLQYAVNCGMKLHYLNREDYRLKTSDNIIKSLEDIYGPFYLIPEGGSNIPGTRGSAEIIRGVEISFDYVCVPCGSGGTLAGIISYLNGKKKALGFAVLKNGEFLKDLVNKLVHSYSGRTFANWDIITQYHFGGYAKFDSELIRFVRNFYAETGIPIEPVYSGKMFYGIFDMIKNGFFKYGETILAVHTGGLQGIKGIEEKINEKLF
jgi:1-aminocyclopropane-1-carboxylate deaminase